VRGTHLGLFCTEATLPNSTGAATLMKYLVETFGVGVTEEPPPYWTGTQYQTVRGCHPEEGSKKQVERLSFLIVWDIRAWLLLQWMGGGGGIKIDK